MQLLRSGPRISPKSRQQQGVCREAVALEWINTRILSHPSLPPSTSLLPPFPPPFFTVEKAIILKLHLPLFLIPDLFILKWIHLIGSCLILLFRFSIHLERKKFHLDTDPISHAEPLHSEAQLRNGATQIS